MIADQKKARAQRKLEARIEAKWELNKPAAPSSGNVNKL